MTTGWLQPMFDAVDARDAARFVQFLTDDALFRFGNLPACRGKSEIGRSVEGFFGGIAACRHEIESSWASGSVVTCHGRVTYTRHDGSQVTVPFADILTTRGALVSEYLIFADISPLFAQPPKA